MSLYGICDMKKYLFLQLKRQVRILPLVLAVTFVLFCGVSAVLTRLIDTFNNSDEQKVFRLAIAGDTEGSYIELGLAALQTVDDTRFTMEIVLMEESEAEEQLREGKLTAYAVLPEDFIENALAGKLDKIRFVTTSGDRGVTTMLKNEFTHVITDTVVYSQKGAYGLLDAFEELDAYHEDKWELFDRLSIEYVDLVLHRNDVADIEITGVSDGLSLPRYYLCAMAVLLLMLMGIPFASVCIRKDSAMESLLVSRGFSPKGQLACEYIAHFTLLCAAALFMTLCIRFMPGIASLIGEADEIAHLSAPFVLRLVMSVVLLSAVNIFIFELAGDLVSGILLHFFATASLCYAGGCFYPISSFPVVIQRMSELLPTGILRGFMAGIFNDDLSVGASVLKIAVWTAVLLGTAYAVRRYKLARSRG